MFIIVVASYPDQLLVETRGEFVYLRLISTTCAVSLSRRVQRLFSTSQVDKEVVEAALWGEPDAKTLELAVEWARDPSRRVCYMTDSLGALYIRVSARDVKDLVTDKAINS